MISFILISVQLSLTEDLPETVVRLEETLLDGVVNKSAIDFFFFCLVKDSRHAGLLPLVKD